MYAEKWVINRPVQHKVLCQDDGPLLRVFAVGKSLRRTSYLARKRAASWRLRLSCACLQSLLKHLPVWTTSGHSVAGRG